MDRNIVKPAKNFKRNTTRKNLMIQAVNDFMYRMNACIEQTNKSNKCAFECRLPAAFSLPDSINDNEFRHEMYYNVVCILQDKGYNVKIRLDNKGAGNNNMLYVSWDVESESNMQEWMNKLRSVST